MTPKIDLTNEFLDAAVWNGTLDQAEAILSAHPEIANSSIYTAAVVGDDDAVRRFLALDPANATAKGGVRGWDALTYLCFSKYLRLDPARSDAFVRAARALLEAGAGANTGFYEIAEHTEPYFESAIYGAAGLAHNAELTRLLLDRGADPNDDETPYHAPEGHDNDALKVLLESGKLTADSLATMLARKHDWHDYDGVGLLLEHGADPNQKTRWGRTAIEQAVLRDNGREIIEMLLDHGADATTAAGMAARRGRADLLALFERLGTAIDLSGVEQLLAAAAQNDSAAIQRMIASNPELVTEVNADGGRILAEFARNGNTDGVRLLLDLGVDVRALLDDGDVYWDLAKNSTALHVAAWLARHDTVKLLIDRGAPVNAIDAKGRTALALAVRACVDSYWTRRRSLESVEALLAAGANVTGVPYPCGYAEVDELLAGYQV